MAKELSKAQINHLRRLLGWVRCDIGQTPEEMVSTLRHIASKVDLSDISPEGKGRMMESYEQAKNVPLYVRAAVKSLEPLVKDAEGELIDGESRQQRRLKSPKGSTPEGRALLARVRGILK